MKGYEIVLTADRSFISDYHSLSFLKALRFMPTNILSPILFFNFVSPPVPMMNGGMVLSAPYHTRRTEALLLDSGFSRDQVVVVAPNKLHNFIGKNTRIISITVKDPLSKIHHYSLINPRPKQSYSSLTFLKLINSPWLRKYNSKIIIEGPGARQLANSSRKKKFSIDYVVVGDYLTKTIPAFFNSIIKGESVPEIIYINNNKLTEVPLIRGGVNEGRVEVAKGCNRGCHFCSVSKLHCRPIKDIVYEVKRNVNWGQYNISLHSEDILNYGAKGVLVNKEAVIRLYKRVKNVNGVKNIGQSYFSLASLASQPSLVPEISELIGVGSKDYPYTSTLTGIESGSPRIIEAFMSGKVKPFEPNEWSEIVEQGFAICHDNYWVPIGCIILGLPGETEEDVIKTIDLIERLKPYKSVLSPFVFKAKDKLSQTESFSIKQLKDYHLDLVKILFDHNVYWGKYLIKKKISTIPFFRWLSPFIAPIVEKNIDKAYEILHKELMTSRIG